jgi:hypothetical protein
MNSLGRNMVSFGMKLIKSRTANNGQIKTRAARATLSNI